MRVLLCLFVMLVASPVLADDWHVVRVRGAVTQKISGSWQSVSRGDVLPDDRYLKTGADGRVGLSRGTETIEMQGDTQIRIRDAGADLMTTVLQDFGTVSIEAERRNVQHFSVQTPFLAAVVKGTRFTVRADQRGATVAVDRGVVQVQDTINDLVVDIRPGQEATVTREAPLVVDGAGAISVFSFDGVPVVNGSTTEVNDDANAKAPGNSGNSNASGNGKGNAFGLSKGVAADNRASVNAANRGASDGNAASNASSTAAAHANANSAVAASGAESAGTTDESGTDAVSTSPGNSGDSNSDDSNSHDGNSGDSNAGGNGRGNAHGLNK